MNIKLQFLVSSSLLFLITLAHGALFNSKPFLSKRLAQSFLAIPLVLNPVSFEPAYGIDAFDAAANAMTAKKERVVVNSRDRDSPAAIKRRAVALCKDEKALKAAGYRTTASCTVDAVEGRFDKILGGASAIPETSKSETISSSKASLDESDSKGFSKREKKTDLSNISAAGKKRRALSACKKADTRKAAKMGSESLCTDRVLKGNYDALIEAMEYGY